MSEYAPLYTPGQDVTLQATAAVAAGQLVVVGTGDETCTPSTAASAAWLGVAAFAAASGDDVTVRSGGVQRLVGSGSITRGAIVVAAAAGKVAANATPGDGQQVGIALNSTADGETVLVRMAR